MLWVVPGNCTVCLARSEKSRGSCAWAAPIPVRIANKAVTMICVRMIASLSGGQAIVSGTIEVFQVALICPSDSFVFCFGFAKKPDRRATLIYKFDPFSLDADRRELRCGRDLVAIEPQVFDVLQYLISNRNRVVSNDDLIGAVWQGRIVSEATVSTRMNAVRRAIGDSGEQQRFIRTIARKGYRFVGEVGEQDGVTPDTSPPQKRKKPRRSLSSRSHCPTSPQLPSCRSRTSR